MKKENLIIGMNFVILVALVTISTIAVANNRDTHNGMHNSVDDMRENIILQKNQITGDLLHKGMYRCCLEKPCTLCIEKTPGHGEGASCDCLSDVVNGTHPCGECIGQILEGHGNPLLAEYFAKAIAEKTGHEDVIKEIILEKYGMPIEDQI